MGLHFELWQRYFHDFLLRKLQLGGLRYGAISQQILTTSFGMLDNQDAVSRIISLHCYNHIYHVDLARMAYLLRPLYQIQQVSRCLEVN